MITDHWSERTIDFLAEHLPRAKSTVRIATGFFTVQGYALIRPHLGEKQVRIMVGYDEIGQERLREHLIAAIMRHLSQWDAPNRREAVEDLVRKLKNGQLQVVEQGDWQSVDTRFRKRDHAKLYIFDETGAAVGSSNLTVAGLLHNAEGMTLVTNVGRVHYWVEQYEQYWNAPDTYDLTQALLDALLRWLELSDPYDVYLKTIQALVPEDPSEAPRDDYKLPVKYQQVVIERLLRQLKEYRGAMLVASTGLGKTVMATHTAYRLREQREIYNVVVFAPKQVHPDWEQALDSAGLNHKLFTRNLLDRSMTSGKKSKRLQRALEQIGKTHLIIVDESQYFRNKLQSSGRRARRSFQRLLHAANENGARIILLTATPLGKDIGDLNNQLNLLPHTAPRSYTLGSGQIVIPGVGEHLIDPNAWRVSEGESFFKEFINLPVCTVISTSQVAKNFATRTPEGEFIVFGKERRWLPRILVSTVTVPALFEHTMSQALDKRVFHHELRSFPTRRGWQRTKTNILREAELAWASSPAALRDVIEQTLSNGYKVDFTYRENYRERWLRPILNEMDQFSYQDDTKFQALRRLLEDHREEGRKVVVFTERLATALYLEEGLAAELPELRVANAVEKTEAGPRLRDFEDAYELIVRFAPEANRDRLGGEEPQEEYDVFISTDAFGAGVNLQDASVAISYDLAWTADVIIQRAGRILRFWKEPRRVHLYAFLGNFSTYREGSWKTSQARDRLALLRRRSEQAQKFSGGLAILPEEEDVMYESLADLPGVSMDHLGLVDPGKIEEFTGVSKFLIHITELRQNQARADGIPDDISSALACSRNEHLVYLLLRHNRRYYWTLYEVATETLRQVQEDELLELIQCAEETPPAAVPADTVEKEAQKCRRLWVRQNPELPAEEVERICALYLLPVGEDSSLEPLLRAA